MDHDKRIRTLAFAALTCAGAFATYQLWTPSPPYITQECAGKRYYQRGCFDTPFRELMETGKNTSTLSFRNDNEFQAVLASLGMLWKLHPNTPQLTLTLTGGLLLLILHLANYIPGLVRGPWFSKRRFLLETGECTYWCVMFFSTLGVLFAIGRRLWVYRSYDSIIEQMPNSLDGSEEYGICGDGCVLHVDSDLLEFFLLLLGEYEKVFNLVFLSAIGVVLLAHATYKSAEEPTTANVILHPAAMADGGAVGVVVGAVPVPTVEAPKRVIEGKARVDRTL